MTNARENILLGWREGTLERAARVLEEELGVSLERHHSEFRGGDYWRTNVNSSELITVIGNYIDEEGLHYEEEYPDHTILVEISESKNWEELSEKVQRIPGLERLRHDLYEGETNI